MNARPPSRTSTRRRSSSSASPPSATTPTVSAGTSPTGSRHSDAEARELALPQLEGYRCVIHGSDGTIRGVVERVYPDAYLVSHPEYLDTAQPAHLLDGAALIPRSPEPLVQRLEPFDPAPRGVSLVAGPLIVPAIPAEV
jgi:hypothetical protein